MKIVSQVELEDEEIKKLKAIVPDLEVVLARGVDDALAEIPDTDIFLGRIPQALFREARQLKWVQSFGAGVETCMFPEFIESDITLTNTSGAHIHTMSDHAFALILSISRGIANSVKNQLRNAWIQAADLCQLAGQTLGIVGLGNIGCEIARRGKAFGMRVLAADIRSMECPVFVDQLFGIQDLGLHIPNTTLHLIGVCRFVLKVPCPS